MEAKCTRCGVAGLAKSEEEEGAISGDAQQGAGLGGETKQAGPSSGGAALACGRAAVVSQHPFRDRGAATDLTRRSEPNVLRALFAGEAQAWWRDAGCVGCPGSAPTWGQEDHRAEGWAQHDRRWTRVHHIADSRTLQKREGRSPTPTQAGGGWVDEQRRGRDVVPAACFAGLPNELVLQILGYLDVCDLLAASRTCHRLRRLALAPILHTTRLRRTRAVLPPLLLSPPRPSLAELIARSIFMTHTTVVSRKLSRSLVSIRLSRRLAVRPSLESLVERCVLPVECVPGPGGGGKLAPALVAKKRAIEREKLKDDLRRWIGSVWGGQVRQRAEGVRQWDEHRGIGRVWRLRKFWERVGRGDAGIGAC